MMSFKSLYYTIFLGFFALSLISSEPSQSRGAGAGPETPNTSPSLDGIKAPPAPNEGRQGPVLDPLKSRTLRRLKLQC